MSLRKDTLRPDSCPLLRMLPASEAPAVLPPLGEPRPLPSWPGAAVLALATEPSGRPPEPPWEESVEPSETMVSEDCEWLQVSLEEDGWRLRGHGLEAEEKRPREWTEAGLAVSRLWRLRVRTLRRSSATTSTVGGSTAWGMSLDR